MTALVVIGALVAGTTLLGLLWRSRQGRARRASGEAAEFASGSGATLLQFSTEVCSPCRATHTVLERIAGERDDVAHVELDVTHRPDLASRFNILQTPTTLVLDRTGAIRARIGGAARPDVVRLELDRIIEGAAA